MNKIFYKTLNFMIKIIKYIIFLALLLLLLPIMVIKFFFIIYSVCASPPNYEQQGSKGQTLYEALEMSIAWIIVLYKQFMNQKIENNNVVSSKFANNLTKVVVYVIGIILFIGPILNMCISGYYIKNKDDILQKNFELKQEIENIKDGFKANGKVYKSKDIRFDEYNKIEKIEGFIFEYQIMPSEAKDVCINIMETNNYKFISEVNKNKIKILQFKKNEYISEINFCEEKEIKIALKRYDSFRESKLYTILNPIIVLTSPFNPLRQFE